MPVDGTPKMRNKSSKKLSGRVHPITRRQIIDDLLRGLSPIEISESRNCSYRTVKDNLAELYGAHGLHDNTRFRFVQLAVKLTVERQAHEATITNIGFCSGTRGNVCNACGHP